MEISTATARLAALAHPTRLETFRLLVQIGPDGLPAGQIAARVGCLGNTMSSHLSALSAAGLIVGRRKSRLIIYSVAYETMGELLGFLVADCCSGAPEVCQPINAALDSLRCCTPEAV